MTTVERDTSLVRRIQKLLDKAARTANPHEAEAFAAKAARLVAEHRIDPARLQASRVRRDEPVLLDIALGRGAYVRARLALLTAVGEANDVRVVFRSTPTGTIAHAAGFRSDLDVVEVMYQSLHQQAAAHMATIHRGTAAATQRFRRSFLFGFADRVGEILAASRASTEAAAVPSSAGVTAVALRARVDRVEEYVTRSFGRVRAARAPTTAQARGWVAGADAANGADVGRARLSARPAIGTGQR